MKRLTPAMRGVLLRLFFGDRLMEHDNTAWFGGERVRIATVDGLKSRGLIEGGIIYEDVIEYTLTADGRGAIK